MSKFSQERMSTSGTEACMSPEQWEGKTLEPAGDQWALAVVGWELLTGTPPFMVMKINSVFGIRPRKLQEQRDRWAQATNAIVNTNRIPTQTMPSACQNHFANVTPQKYSWSYRSAKADNVTHSRMD